MADLYLQLAVLVDDRFGFEDCFDLLRWQCLKKQCLKFQTEAVADLAEVEMIEKQCRAS